MSGGLYSDRTQFNDNEDAPLLVCAISYVESNIFDDFSPEVLFPNCLQLYIMSAVVPSCSQTSDLRSIYLQNARLFQIQRYFFRSILYACCTGRVNWKIRVRLQW